MRKRALAVDVEPANAMVCLAAFEAHAQKVLDRNAWDYYSSGADQEQTLRDNLEAFGR